MASKKNVITRCTAETAEEFGFQVPGPVAYCVDFGAIAMCLSQDEDNNWRIDACCGRADTGVDLVSVVLEPREQAAEGYAVLRFAATVRAYEALCEIFPAEDAVKLLKKCGLHAL